MIRSSTFCASSQITGAVRKSLYFSPAASASFRRGHRSSSAAPRKVITAAVPVPTADVIEDTDATTLLTLEERFRIADTDGYAPLAVDNPGYSHQHIADKPARHIGCQAASFWKTRSE
jgi:hypothetical protein